MTYGSETHHSYWLYVYEQEGDNLYDWDNILDIHDNPRATETEWTILDRPEPRDDPVLPHPRAQ